MTNPTNTPANESEAAVDYGNATQMAQELRDALQRIRELADYAEGLLDDLAIYLPNAPES